jgi:hypothetical protein
MQSVIEAIEPEGSVRHASGTGGLSAPPAREA